MANYNSIYEKLVEDENDVLGRVAYSLYKQQKVEYIKSFKSEHNREPTPEDLKQFNASTNTNTAVEGYGIRAQYLINEFLELVLDERAKELDEAYEKRIQDFEKENSETTRKAIEKNNENIEEFSKKISSFMRTSYLHGVAQNIIASVLMGLALFFLFIASSDISFDDILKAYLSPQKSQNASSLQK